MHRIEFLSKTAIFSSLSDSQLNIMASLINEKSYNEGQFIVKDKDIMNSLCLLNTGSVKLTKFAQNGKEQIVHIYHQGEIMGLCTLFTDNLFPANAVALEKSSVYLISKKKLEQIAYKDSTLLLNLVFALSARLAESMTMIESLSLMKIHQRLASFLMYSRCVTENESRIELPYCQQELAKMLGATPESLSRSLTKMKQNGIITMEGRIITIRDIKSLTDII